VSHEEAYAYTLALQLTANSNEDERLVAEYDIPEHCHCAVAKLLGYDSPSGLVNCYPISLDVVKRIIQQCNLGIEEPKAASDHSWFVEACADRNA
jgi:hypothetical protein